MSNLPTFPLCVCVSTQHKTSFSSTLHFTSFQSIHFIHTSAFYVHFKNCLHLQQFNSTQLTSILTNQPPLTMHLTLLTFLTFTTSAILTSAQVILYSPPPLSKHPKKLTLPPQQHQHLRIHLPLHPPQRRLLHRPIPLLQHNRTLHRHRGRSRQLQ